MKPGKKIQRKLEQRQNGFKRLAEDHKAMGKSFQPEAYTAPGSRNPKKS